METLPWSGVVHGATSRYRVLHQSLRGRTGAAFDFSKEKTT